MHRGLAVSAQTAIGTALVAALWGLASLIYAVPAQAQESAQLERHAWASGTPWARELGWLEQEVEACRAAAGSYAADPCDQFISEALDRIYGIADFRDGSGDGYLGMSAVLSAVRYGNAGWTTLGSADDQAALDAAQARANAGDAVLAALPTPSGGHVALILPGQTAASSSWEHSVPNSVSLFISNSQRSYAGKRLSYSFDGSTAGQVIFFARSPGTATAAAAPSGGQPAGQPSTPFEDEAANDATTGYLNAPVQAGIAGLDANAPPQLTTALAAADKATRDEHGAAEPAAGVFGLWCEAGSKSAPGKIQALVINGTGGTLSWGHVDKARAYAFEGDVARLIVEIERNGDIVSISFAHAADQAKEATAFFVLDGKDKLFESHIFDHAKGEIRPKDIVLERCPGRDNQTAAGG